MTISYSGVLSPAGGTQQSTGPPRRLASIRRWAGVGIAAQVMFVGSGLAAASWQGPHYSALKHSISEMYAVTAPHAMFLLVVLTVCGAATIWFTVRSVWPALRPGGLGRDRGCGPAGAVRRRPGRPADPRRAGGLPDGRPGVHHRQDGLEPGREGG